MEEARLANDLTVLFNQHFGNLFRDASMNCVVVETENAIKGRLFVTSEGKQLELNFTIS